jgi:LysM repeat protein
MLEQKNKGRARVKIAVFLVLTIHGVGLLALLMQGCKKEPDTGSTSAADQATNNPAPVFEQTNLPVVDTNPPMVATNTQAAPETPAAGPTIRTDYKIAAGDTFSTLSKKFHVSIKALEDANPGVEPTKLKIGQTVHIPPPTSSSTASAQVVPSASDNNNGTQMYTVKSGDSLTKIATEFGVTVKALRSANSLTTDKIVVGQKLKLPAKATPTTDQSSAPTSTSGSTPTGK